VTAPDGLALGWAGPDNHGIIRLARQIAVAAGHLGFGGAVLSEQEPTRVPELVDRVPPGVRQLHLHLNDWLLSSGEAPAADVIAALAQRLHRRGVRLTVTLHDLPQPADGAELYRRRCADYRSIVAMAAGVVVSSDHERALLQDAVGDPAVPVEVVPLPIDPLPGWPSVPRDTAPVTVGMLGYLFPGKGHRDVLEELAGLATPVTVVAIGRPSPGQEYLLDDLTALARRLGVGFRCTGYVPDAELPAELRRVTVPLAAHTRVSASGSINSWIAAGRRPLVAAGRYVTELDARLPGALRIYQPGELRQAVETAIAEPDLTALAAGVTVGPSTEGVAQQYLNWLRGIAAD
jgi:glycosyltransferase involved in cell wall biosynthesis